MPAQWARWPALRGWHKIKDHEKTILTAWNDTADDGSSSSKKY